MKEINFPKIENCSMSVCYSETNVHEHFFQIDRHFHNQYEIYLNLSGDISFMVEGNVYPVTRGDIIITKAYEYHNCIYRSDKPHKHFWILFSFEDETILPFPFSNREKGEQNLISLSPEMKNEAIEICEKFVNTDLSKIEEYMLFFRFIYLISSGNTAKPHHSYGAIPKELSLCMNIISQNATNGITLKQLSAETFLSISTIERLFKKHLLMTPMEFITDRKLSLAKDLLETNKSIAEISFECGFSDSSHFILAFKKKHNITPLKYRKLLEKH